MEIKILKPGNKVVLHEDELGKKIIGTISSVTICSDLSIYYYVQWWNDNTLIRQSFSPTQLNEEIHAEYVTLKMD